MRLPFHKLSPGGNPTLLFTACLPDEQQAAIAEECLGSDHLHAEQAGFVHPEKPELRMAGGEFCLNATRCLGLVLVEEKRMPACGHDKDGHPCQWQGEATVSGLEESVRLHVHRKHNNYSVTALLPLQKKITTDQLTSDMTLLHLPGISHLLIATNQQPFPVAAWAQASNALRQRFGLTDHDACGCVWWEDMGRTATGQRALRAHPVVTVRHPFSQHYESSCGSGALALALHMHQQEGATDFSILQPSNIPLTVRLHAVQHKQGQGLMAEVGGPVRLCAKGTAFIHGAGLASEGTA